jgi:hypothetical protein
MKHQNSQLEDMDGNGIGLLLRLNVYYSTYFYYFIYEYECKQILD